MKLRKDRLSDEVSRIDSTGAGNCARISTFAPLGMQICMMCESVTAHFRMGTESYFQFCHLQLQVFWVRDTASMVSQIARRTSPPFVIVVLVCCGVAPLPIGCGTTCKFPLRSKNKSFKMKATNFRTPFLLQQELISLRRLKNVELHQAEGRQQLRCRKQLAGSGGHDATAGSKKNYKQIDIWVQISIHQMT